MGKKKNREEMYTVWFTGSYFSLCTQITAEDEDQAIENARALVEDQHGFDLTGEADDASAEVTE